MNPHVGPPTLEAALAPTDAGQRRQYPPSAQSPLWALIASVALSVVAYVTMLWAASDFTVTLDDRTAQVRWPAQMWLGLAAMALALVASVIWLSLIGTNSSTFGSGAVVAVLVPWWLPLAFVPFLGFFALIGVFLVLYFWPWRTIITGVTEACDLPGPLALLGWLPYPLAFALLTGPDVVAAAGVVLSVVQVFYTWGVLLAATVIQHLGIASDRREAARAPVVG